MSEKEMKDQVDYMVKKFQEYVAKFEDLNKHVNTLSQILGQADKTMISNQNMHNDLEERFSNFVKDAKESVHILREQIMIFAPKIEKLMTHKNEMEKNFGDITNKISSLNGQYAEINKSLSNFALVNDIKSTHAYVTDYQGAVNSRFQDFEEKHIGQNASINSLKSFIGSVQDDLQQHKMFSRKISEELDDLTDKHKTLQLTSNTSFHDLKGVVMQYVDDKIAAIPQPNIPSLDDAKSYAEKKVEPALLDAKNANLRSSNNESKIYILEKKVEQLQLLINKLQLKG